MISEEDQKRIDYLKSVGYGWAQFAQSVESQGWVSDRQRVTLVTMKQRIERFKRKPRKGFGDDLGGIGCSDSEAMRYGEYF